MHEVDGGPYLTYVVYKIISISKHASAKSRNHERMTATGFFPLEICIYLNGVN